MRRVVVVVLAALVLSPGASVAGPARLLRDINKSPSGALFEPPSSLQRAGDLVLFEANDGFGPALWRTDGTSAGTVRLVALEGAERDLTVDAVVDGWIYFTIGSDRHPSAKVVWRTDGTPQHTRPVYDDGPPFAPRGAKEWNGATYYFDRAMHPEFSDAYSVWKLADTRFEELGGQLNGTYPFENWSSALGVFGPGLFFYGYDREHSAEPWHSDGTPEGTELLRDIVPGAQDSLPTYGAQFTALSDRICFFTGDSLACSDGTSSGTVPVASVFGGRQMFAANNLAFFTEGGLGDEELWRSDGTPDGTFSLGSIDSTAFAFDGKVYFLRTPSGGGPFDPPDGELWRTDGSRAGTVKVSHFPSERTGYRCHAWQPVAVGGVFVFLIDTSSFVCELAAFDPVTMTVTRLVDHAPGSGTLEGNNMVELNGRALFVGTLQYQDIAELWQSDGTRQGTAVLRAGLAHTADSHPTPFLAVDAGVVFVARNEVGARQVWFSDGTTQGTVRLTDFGNDFRLAPIVVPFQGGAVFTAFEEIRQQLWVVSGAGVPLEIGNYSTSGPGSLYATAQRVYFDSDAGLSSTDGTLAGTGTVSPARADFSFGAAELRQVLLFTNDVDHKLWHTDGTRFGTYALWIPEDEAQAPPREVTRAGPLAYFRAGTRAEGEELWMSDGTMPGTHLVDDIRIDDQGGQRGSQPRHLTGVDDWLYFDADDGVHGREPWRSNGLKPEMIADLAPGSTSSIEFDDSALPAPQTFAHDGLVYFRASVPEASSLWRSDGTATGTFALRLGTTASNFIAIEDRVFFLDGDCGADHRTGLWQSDGTPDGTRCIFLLDSLASFTTDAADVWSVSNGRLYFGATEPQAGLEPWSVPTAALLCRGDEDGDRYVEIAELVRGVNSALLTDPRVATSFDADHDGRIAISELIIAVRNALEGCTSSESL